MKNKTTAQRVFFIGLIAVAIAYAAAIAKLIIFKNGLCTDMRALNLVPFDIMKGFDMDVSTTLKNILGNFAIFIPLGILVPAFSRKPGFWKTVLWGFGVSLFCEVFQYIVGCGTADVDDLIINTLGAVFGAGIYFLFIKRAGERTLMVSFIVLVAFGLCGIVALWQFSPASLPPVIEYQNKEILNGFDGEGYDISTVGLGINEDGISCDPNKSYVASTSSAAAQAEYPLTEDVKLYTKTLSAQLSLNGNVQKTIVTYDEVTMQEADGLMSSENRFVDLWINESGECTAAMLTVYAEH